MDVTEITIGTRTLKLTRMNVAEHKRATAFAYELKDLRDRGAVSAEIGHKFSEFMIEMVCASIVRAQPEMTRAQLEQTFDYHDIVKVFETLCTFSLADDFATSRGHWNGSN